MAGGRKGRGRGVGGGGDGGADRRLLGVQRQTDRLGGGGVGIDDGDARDRACRGERVRFRSPRPLLGLQSLERLLAQPWEAGRHPAAALVTVASVCCCCCCCCRRTVRGLIVITQGHRLFAHERLDPEPAVALLVATANGALEQLAVAAVCLSVVVVVVAADLTIEAVTTTTTRKKKRERTRGGLSDAQGQQQVEDGVAFVGGMREVVAVAAGGEGGLGGEGERGPFVFGSGRVEVVVVFVLDDGGRARPGNVETVGADAAVIDTGGGADVAFVRFGVQAPKGYCCTEILVEDSHLGAQFAKPSCGIKLSLEVWGSKRLSVAILGGELGVVELGIFALSFALACCCTWLLRGSASPHRK